jgi:hypothetical protein
LMSFARLSFSAMTSSSAVRAWRNASSAIDLFSRLTVRFMQ